MIKYTVQHHFHVMVMQCLTDGLKIIVRSQPTVNLHEISCVISVIVRLKNGVQDDRTDPELLKISGPFADF